MHKDPPSRSGRKRMRTFTKAGQSKRNYRIMSSDQFSRWDHALSVKQQSHGKVANLRNWPLVKTSKYCPWGANGNSANDYSRSLIKGTTTSGKLCLQRVPLLQQKALPFFDNSGWTFGWHSFDLSFAEQNTSPGKGKDCLWSAAHSNIYLLEDLNAPSSTPNWNSATNGNTWLCLIYPRLGITLLKITFKLPAPLTRW